MYEFFFGTGLGREILAALIPAIILIVFGKWFTKREKARDEAFAELRQKEKDERDKRDEQFSTLLTNNLRCSCATMKFSVAIADAVESGVVNGKMKKAREFAERMNEEQIDFLTGVGIRKVAED